MKSKGKGQQEPIDQQKNCPVHCQLGLCLALSCYFPEKFGHSQSLPYTLSPSNMYIVYY